MSEENAPDYRQVLKSLPKQLTPIDQTQIYQGDVEDIMTFADPDKTAANTQAFVDEDEETEVAKRNRKEHNARDVNGVGWTEYMALWRRAYLPDCPPTWFVSARSDEDPLLATWPVEIQHTRHSWAVNLYGTHGARVLMSGPVEERGEGGRRRRTPRHKTGREAFDIILHNAGISPPNVKPPRDRDPAPSEMIALIRTRGKEEGTSLPDRRVLLQEGLSPDIIAALHAPVDEPETSPAIVINQGSSALDHLKDEHRRREEELEQLQEECRAAEHRLQKARHAEETKRNEIAKLAAAIEVLA